MLVCGSYLARRGLDPINVAKVLSIADNKIPDKSTECHHVPCGCQSEHRIVPSQSVQVVPHGQRWTGKSSPGILQACRARHPRRPQRSDGPTPRRWPFGEPSWWKRPLTTCQARARLLTHVRRCFGSTTRNPGFGPTWGSRGKSMRWHCRIVLGSVLPCLQIKDGLACSTRAVDSTAK